MMHCLSVEQTIVVTSLKGMLCFKKLALNPGRTRNLISNYRYCSFLKEKLQSYFLVKPISSTKGIHQIIQLYLSFEVLEFQQVSHHQPAVHPTVIQNQYCYS